jgi:hypothetical protein
VPQVGLSRREAYSDAVADAPVRQHAARHQLVNGGPGDTEALRYLAAVKRALVGTAKLGRSRRRLFLDPVHRAVRIWAEKPAIGWKPESRWTQS